jgi:hypothetical protein
MPPAVAERLERFRATKHPTALWPHVGERAFTRAMEGIARASATLLAGGTAEPLALASGVSPAAFGVAAFAAGLGPLLGYWHERGRLPADPALAPVLAEHLDHGRRRAARLAAELARVLQRLDAAGIPVALLKGAHTAYAYFPEPGTRPMADLDLLVAPADVAATQRVLRDLGFEEHGSDSAPHRSEWARPDAHLVHSVDLDHVDNPWSIELHATLDRMYAPGSVARFGPFDIAAAPERRDVGPPARCLPQPLLMAYVACHASNHFPQLPLLRLAELALIGGRDFRTPEAWQALDTFLTETGTERFAFPALTLAQALVPDLAPDSLIRRIAERTPRALRRLVHRTTPATSLRFAAARPGYIPLWAATWRERMAYVAHLVWPHRAGGPVGVREGLAWQVDRLSRMLRTVLRRKA